MPLLVVAGCGGAVKTASESRARFDDPLVGDVWMDVKRVGLGVIGGVVLGFAVLVVLRELASALFQGLAVQDADRMRLPSLLLILSGVAVGVIILAFRNYPLVGGVAGIFVVVVYVPLTFFATMPGWYPDWLIETILLTTGAAPLLVGGTLIGAAGWTALRPSGT